MSGHDTTDHECIAKTVLVFLVRGLCSSLEYPYAQFACRNLKASMMYRPVTEAIFRLKRLGLKVTLIILYSKVYTISLCLNIQTCI